jgi:hypothetical protein
MLLDLAFPKKGHMYVFVREYEFILLEIDGALQFKG